MSVKYPIRIESCPIVECKVDVFCKFNVPNVVAIGLIYNTLQKLYLGKRLSMIQLPVGDIPEEIRQKDPNLRNQATNSISCAFDGEVQIGPYGFSLSMLLPYKGWIEHRLFLKKVLEAVNPLGICDDILHINVRYLDFFKANIFDKINLRFCFEGRRFHALNPIYKVQIPDEEVLHILQITQGVHIENPNLKLSDNGSLIDITSSIKEPDKANLLNAFDRCHDANKRLFFDLLKQEFIETLNPLYE